MRMQLPLPSIFIVVGCIIVISSVNGRNVDNAEGPFEREMIKKLEAERGDGPPSDPLFPVEIETTEGPATVDTTDGPAPTETTEEPAPSNETPEDAEIDNASEVDIEDAIDDAYEPVVMDEIDVAPEPDVSNEIDNAPEPAD